MAYQDIPRFVVGDEVVNDAGDQGEIVLSYPRKSDSKQFPMVRVLAGARTGQRVWPNGWRALLDHEGCHCLNAKRQRCEQCERTYHGPSGLCRQCQRRDDIERTQYENSGASQEPAHGFGRAAWTRRAMRRQE